MRWSLVHLLFTPQSFLVILSLLAPSMFADSEGPSREQLSCESWHGVVQVSLFPIYESIFAVFLVKKRFSHRFNPDIRKLQKNGILTWEIKATSISVISWYKKWVWAEMQSWRHSECVLIQFPGLENIGRFPVFKEQTCIWNRYRPSGITAGIVCKKFILMYKSIYSVASIMQKYLNNYKY